MIKRKWVLGLFILSMLSDVYAQPRMLSVEEMFRLADENSKSIHVHSLAMSEAAQAERVARNGLLPSIEAQVELNYIGDGCMTDRNFSNGIHADMPHFGNSYVLKATQVIYAGGKITSGIKSSRLNKQLSELSFLDNQQNLRFMLLGYYLDLFQLGNQEMVYEKNIEQTRLLVKDMEAAYRQGTALKSDITRYELQLQNLELGLTSTRNRMNVLNYRLATTIGLDPQTVIVPDTTCLMRERAEEKAEELWMQEAAGAPRLQMADVRIDLSKESQQLARAERRPQIHLTVTNDFTGPILVEVPPLNNNFTYWFAGVGISYSFDALFKSNKKLKQARIHTMQMQERRRWEEEELENDIHAAYTDLNEAYIRLHTQEKSVQLAHENYHIVRQRYLNGLALITDMLDASNTQLDTELQLANDEIGILYQYYLLKKIAGTL